MCIRDRPLGYIIANANFFADFRAPELRRKIYLGAAHQAHGHADIPAGPSKVGVLTVGIAAFVVFLQIFRAPLADMKPRLHHVIFENMITPLAYVPGYRSAQTPSGLFDLGHDTGIRSQLSCRALNQGISDLRSE